MHDCLKTHVYYLFMRAYQISMLCNVTLNLNSFDFERNVPVKQKHNENINLNIVLDLQISCMYSNRVKWNFLFQRIFFFVHKHIRFSICKTEMQNDSCLLPSFLSLISFTSSQQQRTVCSLCVSTILLLFQMANCLSKKNEENLLRWCLFALMSLFTLKWYKSM